ncbi:LysM peptidoglycan-binding domain-containing protein [Microbacterium sp. YJN-G]|uniref:LysM peptidoglycan-binding domain-containing protein n=1 Tax=Microbacterium sp. YJN-G TaxID=2763257 RepID=UPI001878B60E|nr:LysM peptidoglycan-binding domain-containing protein [Microbacterium sp. YJN-G]
MSTISIQVPAIARVSAGARSASRTRLRLTARGRRVLTAFAAAPVVAVLAFSVFAGGSALASGDQAANVQFQTVTVMPGDTLWSIASTVAPNDDPRDVIDDIQRLNNLSTGMIQIGDEIAIPVEYAR